MLRTELTLFPGIILAFTCSELFFLSTQLQSFIDIHNWNLFLFQKARHYANQTV